MSYYKLNNINKLNNNESIQLRKRTVITEWEVEEWPFYEWCPLLVFVLHLSCLIAYDCECSSQPFIEGGWSALDDASARLYQ